jgi:hypothetical protein
MNLTLHIVRKDLRRLRWWLLCWVLALLLPLALGVGFLQGSPFGDRSFAGKSDEFERALATIYFLEILFGYLLTILLLQDDTVLGTRQFWLTRPISRGRLLRAKLLGVFIILALIPILVSLPWWLWHRLSFLQVGVGALEILVIATLVAVPAAFLGTITETFSRAILWNFALIAFVLSSGAFLPRFGGVIPGLAAVFICLAVVTVRLFFTRRRSWSLLWVAALAPVLMLAAVWVTPRFPTESKPRERHAELGAGVTVKFARASTEKSAQQSYEPAGREKVQDVRTVFAVDGVSPDAALVVAGSWQTFRWPGISRSLFSFPGWSPLSRRLEPLARLGLREPPPDPETQRWRAEDRARRVREGKAPPAPATPEQPLADNHIVFHAQLPPSLVARMLTEPPALHADIWLRLARLEILYELPLQPGRWVHQNGVGARIDQVTRGTAVQNPQAVVTLVESAPAPLWSIIYGGWAGGQWHAHHQPFSLAILNRARGEIGNEVRPDDSRTAVINGVRVTWHVAGIYPGFVRRGEQWLHRPGFIDGASLALMHLREEALFKREVNVERLPVEIPRARTTGGP